MNRIDRLAARLEDRLTMATSRPGTAGYAAATRIWSMTDRKPALIAHCANAGDVQHAVRLAREADVPLSVRGGGHDWAGRALCDGLVIDLSSLRTVQVADDRSWARVGGGARARDLLGVTDILGLAAATGSVGSVGLAGLTLGGGYGPLTGRFGLACDNLIAAELVLADGSGITVTEQSEPELLWALRGGGGNFGVVTAMDVRLHVLPTVLSGLILYPFEAARAVLEGVSAIAANAPDNLDIQAVLLSGPDGGPVTCLAVTWSGDPDAASPYIDALVALAEPFLTDIRPQAYGESRTAFDPFLTNGDRNFIDSLWFRTLDGAVTDTMIECMRNRPSPGCLLATHELHGAAARVPAENTAFGFRDPHVTLEIFGSAPADDPHAGERERDWVRESAARLAPLALPGGYANLLGPDVGERRRASFGPNAERLAAAKHRFDPENRFWSSIPLPDREMSVEAVA